MLKALELVGFKSFADKTRFEFPPGITVVVGPNGSGKSNVVDAIKWVLGEQSVKSLRGREMADVIFNGSGARRPANTAEITLTLDNAGGRLPFESPEVHITRRVYRSGEGEYLLNRQPCRLRDLRDLLSGTGLGTEAYSVIEQGKVDVLLQSSARDRRVIFEEAAGISRFKVKKIEALRRLERVDQNLLRLRDIVDEVESRLRSVRAQAGKARRYKEYSDRLQELRTQVALVDWRRLSAALETAQSQIAQLEADRSGATGRAAQCETDLAAHDQSLADLTQTLRAAEAQAAACREQIVAAQAAIEHQWAAHGDLQQQWARGRQQWRSLSSRAGGLQQQMAESLQATRAAEEHFRQTARTLADAERRLTELLGKLDAARLENQRCHEAQVAQMRSVGLLSSELAGLRSQVAAAQQAQQEIATRRTRIEAQSLHLQATLEQQHARRDELARQVQTQEELLRDARARLADWEQQLAALIQQLNETRQQQSACRERRAVLEELERRQEGITAGVRAMLAAAQAGDGPAAAIRGLVADLLQVQIEHATLIEAALGRQAEFLVAARREDLIAWIRQQSARLPGRVGFLWQDDPPPLPSPDLSGQPGVLGRADRFVEAAPAFGPLVERLLGRTWFVEDLPAALCLAAGVGNGQSFVTLAGEFLAADGTLVVGPREHAAGLISRRSELRALAVQVADFDRQAASLDDQIHQRREEVSRQQASVQSLSDAYQQALEALGECRFQLAALQQEQSRLAQQRSALEQEGTAAAAQHDKLLADLAAKESQKREAETTLASLEARRGAMVAEAEALQVKQQAAGRETTNLRVELAKSEERLRNLRGRLRQFEENQQERQRSLAETRAQLDAVASRAAQIEAAILAAESELARLYLQKEASAAQVAAAEVQRALQTSQRAAGMAQLQEAHAQARIVEEQLHARQLEANEVRHQRSALADRLREDYGIELAALDGPSREEDQRQSVQEEIDDLRRKLNSLGNVNLEALAELEELESRHGGLAEQYRDLAKAKQALEQIIDQMNADSRRLLSETIETVKNHFQELFRDLFGGGRADIVLEEGVDILESGIEIVARPPGKEPRSISLLSGGEKTLTCVALLLAVFRSRPSPFCVLDEVDAALDEANIARFTKVLEGFLDWTQFIIVTHSKKTMTSATTIYGVTMQESGVSKQVSVRFEDVSEDGHIRPSAVPPSDQGQEEAA